MKLKHWLGLLLLVAAVLLIVAAVAPNALPAKIRLWTWIPVWKLLLGVLLIWWVLDRLIRGRGLKEKLNIFFPAALLALLFERELAALFGGDASVNLYNNWLILLAGLVLSVAWALLFSGRRKITRVTVSVNRDGGTAENDNNRAGGGHATDHATEHKASLTSAVTYLDANDGQCHYFKNGLGSTEIYYQNADLGSGTVELELHNSLGEITVHVPDSWIVEYDISNSLGEVDVRPNQNPAGSGRVLKVTGSNSLGEIQIVSP